MEWARSIPEGDLGEIADRRLNQVYQTYQTWKTDDPEGAKAWTETTSLTGAEATKLAIDVSQNNPE